MCSNVYSTCNYVCMYVGVNAFDIMMNSARQIVSKSLPDISPNPTNRKQELRNSFIQFLKEKGLCWFSSEVLASLSLVRTVVDILWLIDGHHDVFNSRSYPIPSLFSHFTGFNMPELSKHRKRAISNMSYHSLKLNSDALFGCLHAGYILGQSSMEWV